MISIKPTPKPRPNADQYDLASLYLFTRYNRATFLAQFGEQAPPWDRNLPIKRWADTTVAKLDPQGLYSFKTISDNPLDGKTPEPYTVTITNAQAAAFNLPGNYAYPKRVVKPSGASVALFDSNGNPAGRQMIPPETLSEFVEAKALIAEMPDGFQVEPDPVISATSGPFMIQYADDESRRPWNLVYPDGSLHNVGKLLELKYKAGVGAPGHWELVQRSEIAQEVVWVSDVPQDTGEHDLRPEVPFPMRALFDDEQIAVVMPSSVVIQRVKPQLPPTSSGSGLDEETKAAILDTNKRVKQMQRDLTGKKD